MRIKRITIRLTFVVDADAHLEDELRKWSYSLRRGNLEMRSGPSTVAVPSITSDMMNRPSLSAKAHAASPTAVRCSSSHIPRWSGR